MDLLMEADLLKKDPYAHNLDQLPAFKVKNTIG
jgi:hypothetical protein